MGLRNTLVLGALWLLAVPAPRASAQISANTRYAKRITAIRPPNP